MRKKTFETYVKESGIHEKEKMHQAHLGILQSISKADSQNLQWYSTTHSSRHLVSELLLFFGFDKLDIPAAFDTLDQQLQYVSDRLGVTRRKIFLRENWHLETTAPLLCYWQDQQIMLIPSGSSGYTFTVPSTGKTQILTKKIAQAISPEAYCFYKPFQKEQLRFLDLCHFLVSCISTSELVRLFLVSGLVLAINLIIPYLNKVLFDTVIPSGTTADIWAIAGLMLGVAVATASFGLLKTLDFTMVSNKVHVYLQGAVWARLLHLPASFFKKYSASEVYLRAESLTKIGEILSGQTVGIVVTSLLSFIYISQIGGFSAVLIAPTLLISVVLILFSVTLSLLSVAYQKKQIGCSAKLSGFVYEIFAGIAKIKIAGAHIRVFAKWADKYSAMTTATYSPHILIVMSSAIYTALGLGGTILIYFTVAKNHIAPADYIAFNVAFAAFTTILLQFHNIVVQIANVQSYYELAKPILQTKAENAAHLPQVGRLKGNIDINHVSFAYASDDPLVLNNVNISITAGEYVGIVGTSGCGKSTLLRLLLGFELPLSGTVYYDDQDISGVDIGSIRKNIGVVMQNGTLFADDIYANITICNPGLSAEEAFEIAKKAGLEDDINNMPMGMQTIISEDGGGISGGQRQRIMIARAFAANPSILMFDEATSALDNLTQHKIITSLEAFEATKIVIAHRLSTVMHCDKIIVMDKGEIAETGNYESLMQQEGLFFQMAQRQLI